MTTKPLFETIRLSVHGIDLTDAEFFVELVNSPGWLEFIGDRQVNDVNDAREFLNNGFLKSQQEHGFGYYIARDSKQRPVGIAGFLKKDYLQYPDLGFAVLPDFMGQGYATETASAVMNYGFQAFGLSVLDAVTLPHNKPSQAVLKKLGFSEVCDCQAPEGESLILYQWSSV